MRRWTDGVNRQQHNMKDLLGLCIGTDTVLYIVLYGMVYLSFFGTDISLLAITGYMVLTCTIIHALSNLIAQGAHSCTQGGNGLTGPARHADLHPYSRMVYIRASALSTIFSSDRTSTFRGQDDGSISRLGVSIKTFPGRRKFY